MNLDTLVIVLAGGEGTRLWPLTDQRTKPAVPIGGKYRLIDIPISNALNSELRQLHVLTQGKDESLNDHIKKTYPDAEKFQFFVRSISPPGLGISYEGDADAVRQSKINIEKINPKTVLILPGDHLLKMDCAKFLESMYAHNADAAISLIPRPLEYASQLGSVNIDDTNRIIELREKDPETPLRVRGDDTQFYASMGIYAFKTEALYEAMDLEGDLFGRALLPQVIGKMNVFGYDYAKNNIIPERVRVEKDGYFEKIDIARSPDSDYWRDVGTIGEFHEAHMDLISIDPRFNLYSRKWKFFTHHPEQGPGKVVEATNTLVGAGATATNVIGGQNILFTGAYVDRSSLYNTLVFDKSDIQRSSLQNTIVDKDAILRGITIGLDDKKDIAAGIWIDTDSGIRVIPKGYNSTSPSSIEHWYSKFERKREELAKK